MSFRWGRRLHHGWVLWTMVGACVASMAVLVVFFVLTIGIPLGGPVAGHPINVGAIQPSLFGTVTAVAADGTISVDSKQPFTSISADASTKIASVTGSAVAISDLKAGAVIAATGKDGGNGRLKADAIAVVSNSGTGLPPAPAPSADWSQWSAIKTQAGQEKAADAIVASGRQLTASFTLARNDGSRQSKIAPTASSTWWLSPDGAWLANVDGARGARTVTLFDLSTRHIVK